MNTRETFSPQPEQTFRETLQVIRGREAVLPGKDSEDSAMDNALEGVARHLSRDLTRESRQSQDEQSADDIRRDLGLPTNEESDRQMLESQPEGDIGSDESNKGQWDRLPGLVFKGEVAAENSETATSDFAGKVLSEVERVKDQLPSAVQKTVDYLKQFEPELSRYLSRSLDSLQETEYAQQVLSVFDKIKAYIPESYYNEVVSQITSTEEAGQKMSKLRNIASVGVDFVPIIGPAKMLIETKRGVTFDGKKLEGWKRVLHGIEGGTFLLLDAAGVGVPISKTVKGSEVGIKLFTRSAAIGRKLGVGREIYGPIYRTGKVIAENPALARVIDKTFDELIIRRKVRLASAVETSG